MIAQKLANPLRDMRSQMPTVIWVGRRSVIEMGCRMGSRTIIMTFSKPSLRMTRTL
jgi:hypothetical protein